MEAGRVRVEASSPKAVLRAEALAVVASSFNVVAQYLVRRGHGRELLGVAALVRVVLLREVAVGLLYLFLRGAAPQTQRVVVVAGGGAQQR